MSRVDNAYKNMYTGLINQIVILIFRFVTRTVFIKTLGSQYLGINGLFSNILIFLSLADLGIGASLVYSLYKPIADKNYQKQNVICKYLQKIYVYTGFVIIIFGLILMPFLNYIIKEEVNFVNLYLVFLLYIFQTASTYLFFPSKIEFLVANQKRYIYNNINTIITIVSNIVQIIILVIFKNFYLYLFVIILFNIIQAFIISKITNHLFPFITNKCDSTLSREEKIKTFNDCKGLILYRLNYIVLVATDNIIISKYLGLALVGIYSNYILVTNSIVNILSTFFNSINASIGNLHVSEGVEKNKFIFDLNNLITVICFGIFSSGVYLLINDFIYIWLGKEYLLSKLFVIILSINLYVEGLRKILSTYRTNYGLFTEAKYIPLVGMILNIVISVVLVTKIGIFGVLLGTLISNLLTFIWFDPYIIYKKIFKKSVFEFYIKNIGYFILFVIISLISEYICSYILVEGIIGFIIHGSILIMLSIIIIVPLYYKSVYGDYIKEIIKNKILRRSK